MEHTLLTPHNIALTEGIPYRTIKHLSRGMRYYDANLDYSFGDNKDLKAINEMEDSLGELSNEQTDLRAVADFCCIWRYDYPQRVHDICAVIGGSPHTALRLHYQISPGRRQVLTDYAKSLKGWILDKPPDDKNFFREGGEETTEKIYCFLGRRDPVKTRLAERTYLGLSSRFLNCSFWGNIADGNPVLLSPSTAQQLPENWSVKMSEIENRIRREMGQEAAGFLCDVGGSSEPACHFKFIRRIDILVSSIGALKWRGNLPPKDGTIKGRRHLTRLYLDVLEKYWNGQKADKMGEAGNEIERDLFLLLGKPTDFKRWLVACLWKNIKNQTLYQAYPMKRWVEFVRIGEDYLRGLEI